MKLFHAFIKYLLFKKKAMSKNQKSKTIDVNSGMEFDELRKQEEEHLQNVISKPTQEEIFEALKESQHIMKEFKRQLNLEASNPLCIVIEANEKIIESAKIWE